MALVAWYKLDGNALDSSGNNWNGTASNMSWGSGKLGQCGVFNGSSSRINMNLEYPKNWGDPFSVSSWVHVPSSAVWANNYFSNIVSRAYYTGSHGLAKSTTNNRVSFYIRTDSSTYNAYGYIERDRWHHISGVWDGKTGVLYIDGVAVSSISPVISGVPVNYPWDIGGARAFGGSTGSWFDGMIDDVRIYDHALSPKEVKELAKAKVLHYKFDDFQEPTENLIDVGAYTLYSNNGGVYPIQKENYEDHFRVRRNSDFSTYPSAAFSCYTNVFYDSVAGKQYAHSVYVKPEKDVRLSLATSNYVLCPAGVWTRLERVLTASSTGSVRFSGLYSSDSFGPNFNPWIEVRDPQCEEKGHVTPFVPSERPGIVHDCSGYDNHTELALATTPRWVEDAKIGSGAHEFDGSTQYISRTNYPVPTSEFTISCWLKRKGDQVYSATYVGVVGWKFSSELLRGIELYSGNTIRYHDYQGNSHLNTGVVVADNTWYHVAATNDGNTIKVYVDGTLKATATTSLSSNSSSELRIGSNYPSRSFKGLIDDVRIYTTCLSDADILELYQTRGSIDSHGNLYVQDIIETGHKPLIADYTVWEDGQTGSTGLAPYFSVYSGGTSNSRILATDPWGKETVVWKSEPVTNTSTGIYISTMPIDNTKTYRVSWWEKRVTNGDATYANYYFGLHGYGSVNGVSTLAGSTSTNFYFTSGSMTSAVVTSMLGEWNLMVGVVHPHDYTGSTHPDSGRYNVNGKIASTTNCKWLPETTTCRWRTYTIYRTGDGDSRGAIHYSAYPRVDILDGTEPSIQDLLNGFDSRYIDYVRAKGGANPITLDVGDKSSIFGTIREVGLPVRYIRDWANGSTSNTGNHWVEIEAYSGGVNVALGKSATSPILTDGAVASSPYYSQGSGLQSVQVDLGEVCIVEVINVRHYYADGRTYHNTKTEVSADGVNWVTVFDSAIEGEYPETSAGNTIICRPQSFALGASGDVFISELKEV